MKKLWLSGCCLLLALSMTAQRVDLDRYSFTVAYRDLPKMLIDSSYHTYDFQFEAGPLMRLSITNDCPAESLDIEGWRRLETEGHITVQLKMEDLLMIKSDIREREEIKKDKKGNVISRRIWYAPLLTYNYAASLLVKDHTGKQLRQEQLVSRDQQYQYIGSEYPNRAAASGLLLNMITIATQISRDVLYKTIHNLSSSLTWQYGYAERRVTDQAWILDSRNHPEYDDFRSNWALIKNALFKMHPNESLESIREEVKPAITYFKKIRKEYASSSKADRKLRYATYYLLAKLYYYLDDPDNAVKEATGLVLNDFDTRDGRQLEAAAVELKEQLTRNKRKSRHFPLDIYTFNGPHGESLYSVQ